MGRGKEKGGRFVQGRKGTKKRKLLEKKRKKVESVDGRRVLRDKNTHKKRSEI
jgi:hypothetical protein